MEAQSEIEIFLAQIHWRHIIVRSFVTAQIFFIHAFDARDVNAFRLADLLFNFGANVRMFLQKVTNLLFALT